MPRTAALTATVLTAARPDGQGRPAAPEQLQAVAEDLAAFRPQLASVVDQLLAIAQVAGAGITHLAAHQSLSRSCAQLRGPWRAAHPTQVAAHLPPLAAWATTVLPWGFSQGTSDRVAGEAAVLADTVTDEQVLPLLVVLTSQLFALADDAGNNLDVELGGAGG